MLTENKKISLIISFIAIALLISAVDILSFICSIYKVYTFYNRFLYEIRFIFWGWSLTFICAAAAMGTTLYWKPGTPLLRGLVIFLSITAALFSLAVLWILIAMVSMRP